MAALTSTGIDALAIVTRVLLWSASAWLIALACRRASASLRAGVWTAAFVGLLALPALSRAVPSWKLPLLPAAQADARTALAPTSATAVTPAVELPPPAPSAPVGPAVTGRVTLEHQRQVSAVDDARMSSRAATTSRSNAASAASVTASADDRAAAAATGETSNTNSNADRPVNAWLLLAAVWVTGTLLLLTRVAAGRARAAALVRRAAPATDPEFAALAAEACARFGVTRPLRLRLTDDIAVPAIVGIWRPSLLLPVDANEWPVDAKRVVVLHEVAHIARWDALGQLCSQIACAAYWFAPHLWLAARHAASLRELATDDAVLRAGVRPSAYAANLIGIAQHAAGLPSHAFSLAMATSRIDERVAAILNPALRRNAVSIRTALTLGISATLVATAFAAVSPERRPQDPQPPQPPRPAMRPLAPELPSPPEMPAPPAPASTSASWSQAAPPAPPAPPPPPAPAAPPAPPAAPAPAAPTAPAAPSAPAPPAPPAPPLDEAMMPAPPAPPAPPASPARGVAPAPPAPMAPPAPPRHGALPIPPAPPAPVFGQSSSSSHSTTDRPSAFCPGGTSSSSNMSEDNGSVRKWTVKVSGPECAIDLRAQGKFEFNDTFTDVSAISSGGFFRLAVRRDGERRELQIEPRGGGLEHTYKVEGVVRPYDDAAKKWFGDFLIALDRQTAVGVDSRLPALLKQGGADAVLRETAQMPGDYARGVYYAKLSKAVKLTAPQIGKILDQAVTMKTGDYYATELLKSLGTQVVDNPSQRASVLELVNHMSSDYYIVEGVNAAFGPSHATRSDIDFLVRLAPRIKSDYYKDELVRKILSGGRVDGAQRGQLAEITRSMSEDYYIAAMIDALADSSNDAAARRALIDASARVRADHYKSESLRALLRDTHVDEGDLNRMVGAASGIRSDYYKSEALRAILRAPQSTDRVRQAVVEATTGMGQYYRDEVLRAAGRQ